MKLTRPFWLLMNMTSFDVHGCDDGDDDGDDDEKMEIEIVRYILLGGLSDTF